MSRTPFTLRREVTGAFSDVVPRVKDALAAEGFGIVTELDLAATLKKKLGVDRPAHLILGACNPAAAERALQADPAIGTLLPCNVDVHVVGDRVIVEAIDPRRVFQVVELPALDAVAQDIAGRLERALSRMQA